MISLVAALTKKHVIGNNNNLPWHYPDELKYFKKLTLNHTIIMGRKTFVHLPIKPLPQRNHVVLTRSPQVQKTYESVVYTNDFHKLISQYAKDSNEIFVIGGEQIFNLFIPYATKLYLSIIEKDFSGNAFFPKLDFNNYDIISKEKNNNFTKYVFLRKQIKNCSKFQYFCEWEKEYDQNI